MSKTTVSIDGGPEIEIGFPIPVLPRNELIRALARHSAADLLSSLVEREKEILEDIQTAREELEDGKPLVFSFSFSGKLLFDKDKIETAFSYSVKKTCKGEHSLKQDATSEFDFGGGEE
jgi:hypothetical protein